MNEESIPFQVTVTYADTDHLYVFEAVSNIPSPCHVMFVYQTIRVTATTPTHTGNVPDRDNYLSIACVINVRTGRPFCLISVCCN